MCLRERISTLRQVQLGARAIDPRARAEACLVTQGVSYTPKLSVRTPMQRLCHRLLVATGTPKRCATRCRRACVWCTPAQCVAARCLCGVAPIGSERPLCSSHIREVILTLALPGTRRRARARATRTRERSFHPVRTGVRPGLAYSSCSSERTYFSILRNARRKQRQRVARNAAHHGVRA